MTAPVDNGQPRRDFVEYDHPEGAYTVEAHRVTAKTEGDVIVPGGTSQTVREGDVIVRSGNYYHVYSSDVWDELGLDSAREQEDLTPDVEDDEPDQFDPSTVDAGSVRRYLKKPDVSDDEKRRVARAEREGKNRTSAFPAGWTDPEDDESNEDNGDPDQPPVTTNPFAV